MAIKTIKERTTGEVRIAGTLHPVRDELQRHQFGKDVQWVVVGGICNGFATSATIHNTLKSAIAAWEA